MNYIAQINGFWLLHKEHLFTTTEIALYFHLLDICNSLGWKNPFKQSNGYIMSSLNISKPTLVRAKNSLKQFGVIDFESGKHRRDISTFTLTDLTGEKKGLKNFTLNDTLNVTLTDTLNDEDALHNTKQVNETKLNETKENDSPEKKGLKNFTLNDTLPKTDQSGEKEKNSAKKEKFEPPTLDMVRDYFLSRGCIPEKNCPQEGEKFVDYYTNAGWKVGKNKMKDWEAACRNWEKNYQKFNKSEKTTTNYHAGEQNYDTEF